MTEYLLSIDPGLSTGISLLSYDDASVSLEGAWQFSGGVRGFLNWYHLPPQVSLPSRWHDFYGERGNPLNLQGLTVIAEKFNARATSGYSYKTDSLEPLRVEGAMIAQGLMPAEDSPRWRSPVLQYVVAGKDKADKKKRLHAFLKDSGFYVAPKELGTPDADDVRSSIGHALAYLARELKHKPTFELIQRWVDASPSS